MASPRIVLRALVATAFVLGTIACVFAFLPSVDVYRISDGTFLGTRPPVDDHPNWLFGTLVLYLVPGLLVWRSPRPANALAWWMWVIVVSAAALVLTFDLGDWSVREVHHWPSQVFGYAMTALLALVLAVVPLAAAGFALVAWRHRRRAAAAAAPPPLPAARVIKTRA